jgi:hypothetical protein
MMETLRLSGKSMRLQFQSVESKEALTCSPIGSLQFVYILLGTGATDTLHMCVLLCADL